MAQQVRPWLMKPDNGRAPTSARKQTGVSQQNPSGTAARAPRRNSGCTGAIETCRPRHAKRSLARLGASMYGRWVPIKRPHVTLADLADALPLKVLGADLGVDHNPLALEQHYDVGAAEHEKAELVPLAQPGSNLGGQVH